MDGWMDGWIEQRRTGRGKRMSYMHACIADASTAARRVAVDFASESHTHSISLELFSVTLFRARCAPLEQQGEEQGRICVGLKLKLTSRRSKGRKRKKKSLSLCLSVLSEQLALSLSASRTSLTLALTLTRLCIAPLPLAGSTLLAFFPFLPSSIPPFLHSSILPFIPSLSILFPVLLLCSLCPRHSLSRPSCRH